VTGTHLARRWRSRHFNRRSTEPDRETPASENQAAKTLTTFGFAPKG